MTSNIQGPMGLWNGITFMSPAQRSSLGDSVRSPSFLEWNGKFRNLREFAGGRVAILEKYGHLLMELQDRQESVIAERFNINQSESASGVVRTNE